MCLRDSAVENRFDSLSDTTTLGTTRMKALDSSCYQHWLTRCDRQTYRQSSQTAHIKQMTTVTHSMTMPSSTDRPTDRWTHTCMLYIQQTTVYNMNRTRWWQDKLPRICQLSRQCFKNWTKHAQWPISNFSVEYYFFHPSLCLGQVDAL